jgi:hypothetical protein
LSPNDLVRALIPGLIVGGILWGFGAIAGPQFGPGWEDVIEGGAFFVGLVVVLVSLRRKTRAAMRARAP